MWDTIKHNLPRQEELISSYKETLYFLNLRNQEKLELETEIANLKLQIKHIRYFSFILPAPILKFP